MSLTELVQLYTPLAGLVAMAFYMGVLTQRVRALERTQTTDREDTERLVRVETKVDGFGIEIGQIKMSIEGIHRALANIVTGRGSSFIEVGVKPAE